ERGGTGGLIRVARLRATAAATAASSPQQRLTARLRRRSTHPGSELASPSRGRAMVDPFGQPGGWGDWPAAVATATETTLCCAAFSPRCFIIQKNSGSSAAERMYLDKYFDTKPTTQSLNPNADVFYSKNALAQPEDDDGEFSLSLSF
ncbi:unnamed protein product, partial [Ixodes pacificus]